MDRPDQFFTKEIQPRWPDWEPTGPQISDWEDLIRPYRDDDVLRVIKEHGYSKAGSYKTPKLSEVRTLLKKCYYVAPCYRREFCLQKEGTRVFIHSFLHSEQPISDDDLTFAAARDAQKCAGIYGGKWIAHAGMTGVQVAIKRQELHKEPT